VNRYRGSLSVGFVLGFVLMIAAQPSVVSAQSACGEWTRVDPPAAATAAITHVTALSANDAWALNGALGTIHWDGTSWTQVPIPDLSSLGSSFDLDAMGSAGTAMFICGVVSTSVWTNEQLLLIWDGGQWDRVESMELAQNSFGQPRYGAPRAIDGASADDLWIVGTASSNPPQGVANVVLTVHWDGSQLVEYITPGVGDRQNHLYDVSVLAPDDAWAVGEFTSWAGGANGALHGQTFHWDGTSWNHVPNPTETIDMVDLHAVVAIASNDVWAAGRDPNGPLFMHWDGSSWTIVPSPPSAAGTIQKLAAIASDDIWAVDTPGGVPIFGKYYHWDGTAWSVVIPPDVPGATQVSRHGGLAAVGECDVWAVGSVYDGQVLGPFIERFQVGDVTAVPDLEPTVAFLEVSPNPIRHSAQIRFVIPGAILSRAQIYDIRGQLVRALLEEPSLSDHLLWNGRDDAGRNVPDGVYFLRVESSDDRVLTQKLTVVR